MQKKLSAHWYTALLFPAVFIYYEILLRVTTVKGFFQLSSIFMILLCIAYGTVGYLLSTISSSEKGNRIAAICLVTLTALPYLVEYFIFRQFGVFYDLTTIFRGAADAVTGFTNDLISLLVSWNGLLMILLFLLPAILLLIFGKRFFQIRQSSAKKRIIAIVAMAVLLLGSRVGILLNKPLNLLLSTQYNYQGTVGSLGLMTGIGLDLKNILFETDRGFESADFLVVTTEPEETTTPTEPPAEVTVPTKTTEATEPRVVYVPHVMDLELDDPDASSAIAELNAYVAAQTPAMTNEYTGLFAGKNLILITAEAFCAEAIDPELTPTLYRMATKGIQFTDFYQPAGAGTTGGEYQNIFGMLATDGGASFKKTWDNLNYFTMGNQLNRLGYFGIAYHNNDYTFYDRHLTHINLGYSEGFIGYGNGMEEYLEPTWPPSDLEMFVGSLPDYIDNQPFNVYYMTVSGHSNYEIGANAQVAKHWDRVADLEGSKLVRGYRASQLELEDSMAYLIEQLDAAGILDDTVICIAGDHFPYGMDEDPYLEELYGFEIKTALQRDHSALIIWSGCLEAMEPIVVDSPTFTPDILPTLSNLFGTEYDSRLLPGRDALSDTQALVYNLSYDWKTDYGTYTGYYGFVPNDPDAVLPENYVETVSAIVRNKIRFSSGVLEQDYYRYLFGEE